MASSFNHTLAFEHFSGSGRKYLLTPNDINDFKLKVIREQAPPLLLHALPFTYGESTESWTYPGNEIPVKLSDFSLVEICENIERGSGYTKEELGKKFPLDFDDNGNISPGRETDGPGIREIITINGEEIKLFGRNDEVGFYYNALKAFLFTDVLGNIKSSVAANHINSAVTDNNGFSQARWDLENDISLNSRDMRRIKAQQQRYHCRMKSLHQREEETKRQSEMLSTKLNLLEEKQVQLDLTTSALLEREKELCALKSTQEATFLEREKELCALKSKQEATLLEREKELCALESKLEARYQQIEIEVMQKVEGSTSNTRQDLENQQQTLREREAALQAREDTLEQEIKVFKDERGQPLIITNLEDELSRFTTEKAFGMLLSAGGSKANSIINRIRAEYYLLDSESQSD